jgi:hypothetical protein
VSATTSRQPRSCSGAAELLVEEAAPLAGARVVDVGCADVVLSVFGVIFAPDPEPPPNWPG